MMFLGVDGGGTKTEFIIINDEGHIVAHTIQESCHYKQTSFENYEKIIKRGIEEVLNQINLPISEINFAVFGIPGYGEIIEDIDFLEKPIYKLFPNGNFKCVNDSVVAWAGSLACQPGINIVAGTGAIGFGMDINGQVERTSGWGHFCGDEGSAYWLGKKLIEVFTKEADGRMAKTPLYEIVRDELGLKDDFELLDLVLNKYKMDRGKVAQLSKILYTATIVKDEIAISIFRDAAFEHYLMVKSLLEKLDFTSVGEILISYSGGVFNSGNLVLIPLREFLDGLNKNIKLINPILRPVTGASLYAYNLCVGDVHDNVIDRLKAEEIKWNIR